MIVCLEMALSPNGFIARENGEEDWLSSANWQDFLIRAKQAKNIVMGRETYELVTRLYPDYNFDDVEVDHKLVISKQKDLKLPSGYIHASSPESAMDYVSRLGCDELLLIGGGKLNVSFFEKKLVNQISITLQPYLIGKGRRFIDRGDFECELLLKNIEMLTEGRVRIVYAVGYGN